MPFAKCNSCREADLLKAFALVVPKKKVGLSIVGDKQVHPAIVVDVGSDHAPALAGIVTDAHLLTYVRERSVPVVVRTAN